MAQRGDLDLQLDALRARLDKLEARDARKAPKSEPKKAEQAKEPE